MSSKRGKQKEGVEEDFEAFVLHRMLFYDYFHHENFPNIPVSLVSELHNYSTHSASSNQVAIPLFEIFPQHYWKFLLERYSAIH